jgi:hypothetical protein
LRGGANVIVTSGFLEATQDHGFSRLAEWQVTIPELGAQRHVRLVFRRAGELSHAAEAFRSTVRQLAPPPEKADKSAAGV